MVRVNGTATVVDLMDVIGNPVVGYNRRREFHTNYRGGPRGCPFRRRQSAWWWGYPVFRRVFVVICSAQWLSRVPCY